MARLKIIAVEHEAGVEGTRGMGYPVLSKVELQRGEVITSAGEKASALDGAKTAFGYVGFDTGAKAGVVIANQTFRPIREASVYMDVEKPAGTKIYLSDVAGELSDVAGTVPTVVGTYINYEKGRATSDMAVLVFGL
ncbi:MAG: hypothetical protein ACRC6E_08280 [Fusobacteriaceae bacterium]